MTRKSLALVFAAGFFCFSVARGNTPPANCCKVSTGSGCGDNVCHNLEEGSYLEYGDPDVQLYTCISSSKPENRGKVCSSGNKKVICGTVYYFDDWDCPADPDDVTGTFDIQSPVQCDLDHSDLCGIWV